MAKVAKANRLPNAPLSEAVFELRWKLQGAPNNPLGRTDPGLAIVLEQFSTAMKRIGFVSVRDIGPPGSFSLGHTVSRRFYTAPELPFPLMQIGPGLFATNQGVDYEWTRFRAQIQSGVAAVVDSYPDLGVFKLEPEHLELRYIDAFDDSVVGHVSMFDLLNEATTLRVDLPAMLKDTKLFGKDATEGRFIWSEAVKKRKETRFTLDIGTAVENDVKPVVRMESKVISRGAGVPKLTNKRKFLQDVLAWADQAHDITSPFFQGFVKPTTMAKFKKK